MMRHDCTSPDHRASLPELLAAARAGDTGALDQLLAETLPEIDAFLRRCYARNALLDLYDDVTLDTLIRVVRHLPGCRATTAGEYWAWVLTIARREAARTVRETYFRDVSLVAPAVLDALSAARHTEGTESVVEPLLPVLATLLARLDDARQDLLGLRYVEQLSWDEVAEEIGTTPAAAKRRCQRLQRRLGRELREAVSAARGPEGQALRAALAELEKGRTTP